MSLIAVPEVKWEGFLERSQPILVTNCFEIDCKHVTFFNSRLNSDSHHKAISRFAAGNI